MKVRCVIVDSCSTSLPGGNQVDGLPPASSFLENDKFRNFGAIFDYAQNLTIQNENYKFSMVDMYMKIWFELTNDQFEDFLK